MNPLLTKLAWDLGGRLTLPTAVEPAVRAAVKNELSYGNDKLTKIKTML